jgi:hypothetical protein
MNGADEFDLWGTPQRRPDPETAARGVALCAAAIGAVDDSRPLDPTDARRDRALRRARDERAQAARIDRVDRHTQTGAQPCP